MERPKGKGGCRCREPSRPRLFLFPSEVKLPSARVNVPGWWEGRLTLTSLYEVEAEEGRFGCMWWDGMWGVAPSLTA